MSRTRTATLQSRSLYSDYDWPAPALTLCELGPDDSANLYQRVSARARVESCRWPVPTAAGRSMHDRDSDRLRRNLALTAEHAQTLRRRLCRVRRVRI